MVSHHIFKLQSYCKFVIRTRHQIIQYLTNIRVKGSSSIVRHYSVSRALLQNPIRRLTVRSHKVSKPRDLYWELSDRSEIYQAPRQQGCRSACKISKRCDNLKYQSRGFETSRDLTIRRLIEYWNGAQVVWWPKTSVSAAMGMSGWHIWINTTMEELTKIQMEIPRIFRNTIIPTTSLRQYQTPIMRITSWVYSTLLTDTWYTVFNTLHLVFQYEIYDALY